eukprot:5170379-Pyramimonas_sp.AAC.1
MEQRARTLERPRGRRAEKWGEQKRMKEQSTGARRFNHNGLILRIEPRQQGFGTAPDGSTGGIVLEVFLAAQ